MSSIVSKHAATFFTGACCPSGLVHFTNMNGISWIEVDRGRTPDGCVNMPSAYLSSVIISSIVSQHDATFCIGACQPSGLAHFSSIIGISWIEVDRGRLHFSALQSREVDAIRVFVY